MSLDNFTPFFTTIGFGGITGFLFGYFIRKVIKILMFIFGGIFVLPLYLQAQGIITINLSRLQSYVEDIVYSVENILVTITSSSGQFSSSSSFGTEDVQFGIGSMVGGFVIGLIRG
jgi:uncharacterized membrane protein (Fun14 family)